MLSLNRLFHELETPCTCMVCSSGLVRQQLWKAWQDADIIEEMALRLVLYQACLNRVDSVGPRRQAPNTEITCTGCLYTALY